MLSSQKKAAIKLRVSGKSYTEIEDKIGVSKSTLSLWLRNLEISSKLKHRLLTKRLIYARRGAEKRKLERINRTQQLINQSKQIVGALSERELGLIGATLYWAEGAKQKEHNISARVCFSSSDALMTKIFIEWLGKIYKVNKDELIYQLYIHTNTKHDVREHWSQILNISKDRIRVYYKTHKVLSKRKNVGNDYQGLLRVVVRKSTDLNRKIKGYIEGIVENWGVV